MNQILIKVHSVADAISNSSSETVVSSTKITISTIKEIINSVLQLTGSTKSSDDYFDLELATNIRYLDGESDNQVIKFIKSLGVEFTDYGGGYVTSTQIEEIRKFIKEQESDNENFQSDFENNLENGERPTEENVMVTIKDGLQEQELKVAKKIASSISKLMGTYSAESYYS